MTRPCVPRVPTSLLATAAVGHAKTTKVCSFDGICLFTVICFLSKLRQKSSLVLFFFFHLQHKTKRQLSVHQSRRKIKKIIFHREEKERRVFIELLVHHHLHQGFSQPFSALQITIYFRLTKKREPFEKPHVLKTLIEPYPKKLKNTTRVSEKEKTFISKNFSKEKLLLWTKICPKKKKGKTGQHHQIAMVNLGNPSSPRNLE